MITLDLFDDRVPVNVSGCWLRTLWHGCEREYIATVCFGRCCERGGGGTLISLLPEEAAAHGIEVTFMPADPATGKCPNKTGEHLCALHGTGRKPFGCIASPFTLNTSDTLIIRHRYIHLPCFKDGEKPAYIAFRASLDLLFGEAEAGRIASEAEKGKDRIPAHMNASAYQRLKYLDTLKRKAAV